MCLPKLLGNATVLLKWHWNKNIWLHVDSSVGTICSGIVFCPFYVFQKRPNSVVFTSYWAESWWVLVSGQRGLLIKVITESSDTKASDFLWAQPRYHSGTSCLDNKIPTWSRKGGDEYSRILTEVEFTITNLQCAIIYLHLKRMLRHIHCENVLRR